MIRHILRHLGIGILGGFAVGTITGLLEVLVFVLAGDNSVISRGFFFHAVLFYGLGWSLALVPFALMAALLTARGRDKWDGPRITALHVSAGGCLSVLVAVGGYANLLFLPAAGDPRSLLFDLLLLAVCAGLLLLLYRIGRRAFEHFAHEGRLTRVRNITLTGLVLLFLASAALSYIPESKESVGRDEEEADVPYNVILIVIDTLRSDHLSLYGYGRETDPQLKSFARAEAITFTDASAQAAWTKPSVATLLTSLHLSSHGANSLGSILPDSAMTVTEILNERGLRTVFFSANEWISPLFNFDQGVDHFFVNTSSKIDNLIAGHMLDLVGRFIPPVRTLYRWVINFDTFLQSGKFREPENTARLITLKAVEWIETNGGDPFFAYIHYIDPHAPYNPPKPYDRSFDPRYEGEPASTPPPFNGLEPFEKAAPLPPDQLRNMVARYDGEILFCDYWLGRLLEGLRAMRLFDKSLIIVTSDHGEEFYEHGGWDHGQSLFEELIHIPLIIKLPGGSHKGAVVDRLVRHLDVAPTILDVMGSPKHADMDGASLLPFVEGLSAEPPPSLVSLSELDRGGGRIARAIRTPRTKLIEASLSEEEVSLLFDLEEDPQETKDLFKQRTRLARKLSETLRDLQGQALAKAMEGSDSVKISGSLEQRLKALGYMQ